MQTRWSPENTEEVLAARAEFVGQMAKGATAFNMDNPQGAVAIKEFDPTVKETLILPQLVGG
jgi:hypothetical protein